jgi:hypothetical protein
MTDIQVTDAMIRYGGSFVQALAKAYQVADDRNRARLRLTFDDYFKEYQLLAMTKKVQA